MAEGEKQLPRHARIFGYQLDAEEKLILLAIDDHMYRDPGGDTSRDGNTFTASVSTLRAWTSLSKRTIQRRIWGYCTEEGASEEQTEKYRQAWLKGNHKVPYKPGLVDKRILKQVSPGSAEDNTPAMYQFIEAALKDNPKVRAIRERRKQKVLPGFREPMAPGHPIYPEKTVSPDFLPSVSLTPGVYQSSKDPSVRLTHPSDRVTLPLRQADTRPSDRLSHPSVRLTHDPSTNIDTRVNQDLSSYLEYVDSSTTTTEFPAEVAKGLREILPALDDRAIRQIWTDCKKLAPDCTAEEIVHFARSKIAVLQRPSTNNPTGMLIRAVPQCFEGTLLRDYREENKRRAEAQRAAQRKAETEQAAATATRERFLKEEAEREQQIRTELAQMPEEERALLFSQAEVEFLHRHPQARSWPDLGRFIEGEAIDKLFARKGWRRRNG